MIIAGDVGGTKARIGLFDRRAGKVQLVVSEDYASKDYKSLESILGVFMDKHILKPAASAYQVQWSTVGSK